uniref:Hypotheticial protein n=1 Tax=Schistosoma japonicum TaxID=6182 RepID=C1LIH9_SCHJA|nr:hypotheticial protein [Schistosoma japonicum]
MYSIQTGNFLLIKFTLIFILICCICMKIVEMQINKRQGNGFIQFNY